MILLFTGKNDFATNKVIDWLLFTQKEVFIYNGRDKIERYDVCVEISNETEVFQLNIQGVINIRKEIESIWFRRPYGGVNDIFEPIQKDLAGVFPSDKVNKNLKSHKRKFKDFLIRSLRCKTLGSYEKTDLNKPEILLLVKECGLKIPNTIITNSKSNLVAFLEKNNSKIISKALHNTMMHAPENEDNWLSNKTKLIKYLDEIPDQFDVSLFQAYVEKEYELRIFYLDGDFFSACIFSQENPKTEIDFRNYDFENPNRIVPYQLNSSLKISLTKLMHEIDLNTGSIDLIKSTNGDYYFLEINPVGQYDFISGPCNFNIDMEISKYLTNNEF